MRDFLNREFLSNPLEAYLYFFGALAIFFAAGKFSAVIVRHILSRVVRRTTNRYDDVLVEALRGPLMAIMILIGIRIGGAAFRDKTFVHELCVRGVSVASVFVVAWFGIRLWTSFVEKMLVPLSQRENAALDPMLIPVIRRGMIAGIWMFTIILAASDLGYNIVSLLTGLGIGGLAVALAAKDTLSPMVGGVAIFMTKPFAVGHYIVVDDHEGTVEEIGLRATTMRTKGGSMIIVPNDRIINSTILNRHRSGASKVSVRLGVPYDLGGDEIERLCDELRELLKGLPAVDAERGGCKVDSFGDAAIFLKMTYWITDPRRYNEASHRLHLGIKRKFDELGVEFPFPTQAHIVSQAPKPAARKLKAIAQTPPAARPTAHLGPSPSVQLSPSMTPALSLGNAPTQHASFTGNPAAPIAPSTAPAAAPAGPAAARPSSPPPPLPAAPKPGA